jgi:hypothetical protein
MLEKLKLQQIRSHIVSNVELQIIRSKNGQQSPTLWISGPPGLGKSEFMQQICEEKGWGLSICYLSQMTIDMMSGMPMIKVTGEDEDEQKFVPWSIPEVFNFSEMKVQPAPKRKPVESSEEGEIVVSTEDEHEGGGEEIIEMLNNMVGSQQGNEEYKAMATKAMEDVPIILFLDDAHLPERSIQKYMFQMLGEKTIHKHTMPPNVAVILAGNRSEDKAGFQQILAPIANRIRWIDVDYDLDAWVNNYAIPKGIRLDVVSFLQHDQQHFSAKPLESGAWASPRSWTYAALELDMFEHANGGVSTEDAYQIVKGCVGQGPATAFIEYRQLLMQWEAHKIMSGERKVVYERKNAKTRNDIVIGGPNDEDELNRIECYALMSATVGELIKHLRKVDFKPTAKENAMVDIFRDDIIGPITRKFREIVPLGLRAVLSQEKQHRGNAITRRLLVD